MPRDVPVTDVVASGLPFGLSFYVATHWIAGRLLGVGKPEWQSNGVTVGMHTMNHVLFGLITAGGGEVGQPPSR